MTTPGIPMTCDRFADGLAGFLERDASEASRSAMETHAQSCAECGALLADLRALRVDAANLPELVPSRDLWAGIAERIETPVVALNGGTSQLKRDFGSRRRQAAWLGLAAAGLVAVTATATYQLTARSIGSGARSQVATTADPRTLGPANPAPTGAPIQNVAVSADTSAPSSRNGGTSAGAAVKAAPSVPRAAATLASNVVSVERTYDDEIARLRAVVTRRRSQLDSSTVTVLEHNLKVIDDAIAQCKDALRKDPNSRFLIESLNDALDTKVQLLRTAATLPSKA